MTIRPSTKNSFVRTVLGDIPAQEVGFAQCHEHTFILPGMASQLDPDVLLDNLEKTTAELTAFHAIDGRTIVDAQALGQERAPKLQKAASERSGVNIVACTGLHRGMFYAPDHFRFHHHRTEAHPKSAVDDIGHWSAVRAVTARGFRRRGMCPAH